MAEVTEILSSKIEKNVPARSGVGIQTSSGEVSISADDYSIPNGCMLGMFNLQKGQRVLDAILSSEDVDSGSGVVMEVKGVGDTTSITLLDSSTIGQAGGVARASKNIPYELPENMKFAVKLATKPATQKAGKVSLTVIHTNNF
jgi:hypothetical protein